MSVNGQTTNNIAHSLEYLRARYRYDSESGLLYSLKTKLPVGSVSGNRGLVLHIQLDGKQIMYCIHRLIVYIHTGIDPIGFVVYHVNGNNYDNRWENMSVDDPANNAKNRIHQRKLGKQYGVTEINTGKGVRWQARIKVDRKTIYLGRHKSFDDAVAARRKAEALHGFNLRHSL